MKLALKILLGIYIIICIGLYLVQDQLVFHPDPIDADFVYRTGYEVEIPLEEHLDMNALMIQANPNQRSDKAIIYFHGNKGNIRRCIYQTRQMQGLGYDILLPDYRSYGKTEGKPKNDQQILDDAQKAFQYLNQYYDENKITAIGYSLGTGMASYVASKYDLKELILIAPFTSLAGIKNQFAWFVPDFLLKFKLDNDKHIAHCDEAISIVHGTNDHVVNYKFSQELKEKYPEKIELHTIEGESHRGIIFVKKIRDLLTKS